jgi:chromosome segregation protein
LEFAPGICAIVGPNGSGKSNFVDAVRWVLGEQSARQLRGARMDDVIFAGNAQRRPLGMAEVTLTFDNSDGAVATPFSEIAITRRAYRSGESEFFINKTAVRLRDITDMLLGTGLAAELAAVVSQGEIDAILSARPEARRELFEGVAGTARYRERKREAQRRLEQTAANALRVNDVLVELEKQLPAIDYQVRRARRYQKVQQQLRDLEIFSYVKKVQERRRERTRIVEALAGDDAVTAAVAKSRAEQQAQLSKARDDEYQASIALDERNATHSKVAAELARHASAYAAAAAKAGELARTLESLERDADASAAAVSEADARLSRAVEELNRSREARDTALGNAESAAAAEAEQTARWERAYADLRAAEDARASAVAKAMQSASAAAAAQAEHERLLEAAARSDDELQSLHASLQDVEAKARAAGAQREQATSELASLERARDEAARASRTANGELESLRRAAAAASRAAAEARAKKTALDEFAAGRFGAPTGVQVLADAARSHELPGAVGMLADQIEVDERYATAIDALLGPHAHDFVVRSLADATAAVKLLKACRAGRATILALEAAAQAEPGKRPGPDNLPGVIGRACDLVRCDANVKPAIERVLVDAFVVTDLDAAFACARTAPFASFATLDGDVIRGAAITSGSGTGPMSAQALRASLIAEDERLSVAAQEAEEQRARAETAAADALRRVESVQANLAAATIRAHDAQAQLERLADERSLLERRAAAVRQEREAQRTRSTQLEEEVARSRRRAREFSSALETQQQRCREALATADALAAQLNGVRAAHRKAAAEAAALVERVAQSGDDVEAVRAERERASTRRKERQSAVDQTREELAAVRAEVERLAAAQTASEKTVAQVAAELEAARARRDAAVQHARGLEEAYRAQEQRDREQSFDAERRRIRLAEIDAELALLSQTFSQNPATPQECDEVAARYAGFAGDEDAEVRRLREELARLGNVNLNALEDRAATLERCEFLRGQLRDLEAARASIVAGIAEIDAESLRQFNEAFAKVAAAFSETFTRLFNGGQAKIWVADAPDPTEAGIEISAQPPGKKMQNLNLLSGGERALTAVALIFATLQIRPSPFYIFDEIDAALDEANIGRFGVQLTELAAGGRSQIIIITHNKATMTLVDRMYGVTMSEPGVSNVLSLSLERAGAAG